MTEDQEKDVLQYYDGVLATVPNIGRLVPAPLYFKDKRDYLASYADATALSTQTELETSLIRFCSFYYKTFEDDPATPSHSPDKTLFYRLYLFSEYDVERDDENAGPELLARRMLRRHREFVGALLGMVESFQREAAIGLDESLFAKAFSRPLKQLGDVQTQSECEFVPGVTGLSAELEGTVVIRMKEC